MGCLLPWRILKRAIIFPLRLHFTRQTYQPLVQQPLPVSDWSPCARDGANRPKRQPSPGLPDDTMDQLNVLLCKVGEMRYGLLAITSISIMNFFYFSPPIFWLCSFISYVILKLLLLWWCPSREELHCSTVSVPASVLAGRSHDAKHEDCLLQRQGKGTVPPRYILNSSPQRRRKAARKQSLSGTEISFTQCKKILWTSHVFVFQLIII